MAFFKTREKTAGAQRAVGTERPSGTQRPINTQRPTIMQGRAGLQNTQGKRPVPPEFKTREKQVRPERPVKSVISEKPVVKKEENKKEILEFFNKIGIIPKIKNGYYYPYSNQATSIKNALINEAKRKGKRIIIAAHGNSLRGLIKYLDNVSAGMMYAVSKHILHFPHPSIQEHSFCHLIQLL